VGLEPAAELPWHGATSVTGGMLSTFSSLENCHGGSIAASIVGCCP
jgi:hypothetical protein